MKKTALLGALGMALAAGPLAAAHADERESLETLRQTTLNLIQALVDKGILTRDAADALIKSAQAKAQTAAAAPAATTAAGTAAMAPQAAASAPGAEAAATPQTTPDGKRIIRVPYIPESVKNQIREEIRGEIVQQAQAERWGVPGTLPSWMNRIKIDGDFRFRMQSDAQDKNNTPAYYYVASVQSATGSIRAANFAQVAGDGNPATSTTDTVNRERIRLRLGLNAKVSDDVGVGVRLTTGNQNDRVSTNQSLGQDFNKYQLVVDRAFVRIDPLEWLTIEGGRIPNPWFSTDMVWDKDLNFEGLALTSRWPRPPGSQYEMHEYDPFVTLGAFPLRVSSANAPSRWLYGAQVGTSWMPSARSNFKIGLAYYDYVNLEGRQDNDYQTSTTSTGTAFAYGPTYGQYEYPADLRQKGNTLFETDPFKLGAPPVWGLAYRFRPLVLTASARFDHFSPYSLMLQGEFAKNTAFSVGDFQNRFAQSGLNPGGRSTGYQLEMGFGWPEITEFGQWRTSLKYRHLGSDAVLDAFTDSDLGLGGTNVRGYVLGFTYGLDHNTNVQMQYFSSRTLDTPINSLAYPNASYKVNTIMVDLNAHF